MAKDRAASIEWRRWRGLALVLLAALFLRGLYLSELRGAPDFRHPGVDAGFHDDWARTLTDPDWERPSHRPDPGFERHPYLRPPGYPFLLAATYAVSGGSYTAARIVNMALGLATIAMVFGLGRRWFGAGAGLGAALLLILDWAPLYFEGELHAEPAFMASLLGATWLLERWRARPGAGRALAAGLALGLASLFRPNALILAPAAMIWMFLRRREGLTGRDLARGAAGLGLGLVLALVPTTVRNARVAGELVPITTNLGVNLYIGNNPEADGEVTGDLPGVGRFETCYDYPALVNTLEARLGRELSAGQVSAWFHARALEWMRAEPGDFLRLTLRKAALFWGPDDVGHNKVVSLERDRSSVLRWLPVRFPLLLALALVGLFCAMRGGAGQGRADRRSGVEAILLLGGAYFLSVLPFFIAARYRVPIEPFLALAGGFTLAELARASRARDARRVLIGVAAVAALVLASLASPVRSGPDHTKWHVDRALAHAAEGHNQLAFDEYERALSLRPRDARLHFLYGVALADAGHTGAARREYEAAVALEGSYARARNNLALLQSQAGELESAIANLEAAVTSEPSYVLAHANLASARWQAGRFAEALDACRAALALDPRHPVMRRMLVQGHVREGRPRQALVELESLAAAAPEDASLRLDLAWLLATNADEDVRDPARALDLARGLAAESSGRWDALEALAAAEAANGDTARAADIARAALEAARGHVPPGRLVRLRAALQAYLAGQTFVAPH